MSCACGRAERCLSPDAAADDAGGRPCLCDCLAADSPAGRLLAPGHTLNPPRSRAPDLAAAELPAPLVTGSSDCTSATSSQHCRRPAPRTHVAAGAVKPVAPRRAAGAKAPNPENPSALTPRRCACAAAAASAAGRAARLCPGPGAAAVQSSAACTLPPAPSGSWRSARGQQ